jgi:putative membrane protein
LVARQHEHGEFAHRPIHLADNPKQLIHDCSNILSDAQNAIVNPLREDVRMTNLKTTLIVAAALLSTSVFAHAQAGLSDLEIAHAAYTADVIDIEYAKIALSKTKNAEVKTFAELMIRDHTAVNEGASALLKKLNVEPKDNAFSQALVKGAAAKKTELNALDGDAFDKAYAANELAYHQTVNKIVGETWIPSVKNAELKAFLGQALVTFKVHETHAGHMVGALK